MVVVEQATFLGTNHMMHMKLFHGNLILCAHKITDKCYSKEKHFR